jgi:small subunit ribosomal protein S4
MFRGREGERELIQAYGLKNAKELWRAKSEVARIRGLARKLLATPDEKTEKDILDKLKRIGLLDKEAKLEDVLDLVVENLLDRRLQTLAYKKGLANSIKQARQEIVHGHIIVTGQRLNAPGHIMSLEEEQQLDFYATSPLKDPEHPARKIEKKASTDKKEGTEEVEAKDVKPPSEREAPKAEENAEAPKEEKAEEPKPEAPKEEKAEEPKPEAPKEEPKPEAEADAPKEDAEAPKEEPKAEEPAKEEKVEAKEEAEKTESKGEKPDNA